MPIHETADVDAGVTVPESTHVWNYAQIREGAIIGENCVIGRNVYIGPGVRIGNNCKIQNNALIYEPAVIGDGVFVGPGVIFTNDKNPRAINEDGSLKGRSDWNATGVQVSQGAAIGAGSVCIAPVRIGAWALVGAGSVVVREVSPHTVVAGNPARPLKASSSESRPS